MDTKWVKDSFDRGKLELLKIARASRIRIEITSLRKKREERIKLLGSKVVELIENDTLDADLFEPDYSYAKNIEKEIDEKELLLETEPEEDTEEKTTEEEIEIVTIESQKVLTAESIPVEPDGEEEDKKEENKEI